MKRSDYRVLSAPDRQSSRYGSACRSLKDLGGIGNKAGKMSEEEIVETIKEARDERGRNRAGH